VSPLTNRRWRVIVGVVGVLVVGAGAAERSVAGRAAGDSSTLRGAGVALPMPPGPAYGTYDWPVDGPVTRAFEPPEGPFGAGHRGIDIAVPAGTVVRAAADGVVAFAGPVAGSRFVSIDHSDGVRTTYSWVSAISVRAGDPVRRGDPVAASGLGHPGVDPAHLHFGVRYAGTYLDPMLLLRAGSLVGLVRLAPLEEESPPGVDRSGT
jgi:murein DD-endopeptidase MepM/ murein hydrolase activator NlpD